MTTYSNGADFVKALNLAQGPAPGELSLVGFAKATSPPELVGGTTSFQFSPGFDCGLWVTIPASMVSIVERMDQAPCGDHSHDVVRLTFAPPATPESKVLFDLLRYLMNGPAKSSPTATDPVATGGTHHPMMSLGWHNPGSPIAASFHWPPHPPRIPRPNWPPIWPTHGCDLGCSIAFPEFYPQAVAALRTLKGTGVITSSAECHSIAGSVGTLAGYLAQALPIPYAKAIANAIVGRCATCACDQVF